MKMKMKKVNSIRKMILNICKAVKGLDVAIGPVLRYRLQGEPYWGFPVILISTAIVDMVYIGEVAAELDPDVVAAVDSVLYMLRPNELTHDMAIDQHQAIVDKIRAVANSVHVGKSELDTLRYAYGENRHPRFKQLIETIKKEKKGL
jgi:hypothetical protein